MKTRRRTVLAGLLLIVGTAGLVAEQGGGGQNNETRLRTRLTGAAIQGKTPEGNADFRSDQRGRTRLNVEVENVNLPTGTVLNSRDTPWHDEDVGGDDPTIGCRRERIGA